MRVNEIKSQIEFHADALFQAGYDMGWNSLISELDTMSNQVTADVIRNVIKKLEGINEA
jgi:hypothetical protein